MASYLVTQGYSIVTDAYKELIADKKSGALASTDFVSMGKDIDDYDLYDGFYGKITNKIAKTVAYVLSYKADGRNIIHDAISYGAFIEKLYVDEMYPVETPSFKVSFNNSTGQMSNIADPFGVTASYTITSKVFGGSTTWSLEFNTDTHLIKKAFRSESDMMAFIDSIFVKAQTDIELQKESLVNLAINTGIECAARGGCVRNLLREYNIKFNPQTPLTQSTALTNADFLKWANMEINRTLKLMAKPSRRYNAAKYLNASSRESIELEVLSYFADSSRVYLESGTYHDDKVALVGNYVEQAFWQFNDESFALASTVSVKNTELWNDGQSTPTAIEYTQNGIIAIARDKDAVAAIFENNYSWSMPNPRARINSYGYDFERGYMVEPHANFVVFIVADYVEATVTRGSAVIDGAYAVGSEIVIKPTPTTSGKAVTSATYTVNGTSTSLGTPDTDGNYHLVVPVGLSAIAITYAS